MKKTLEKLWEIRQKLSEQPNGYELDDFYSCVICSKVVGKGKGWYDNFGPKCNNCQNAINSGIVPKEVCLYRNRWYAKWEVNMLFHPQTIKAMIRKRKLKPRIVSDKKGKPYFYVFLLNENKILASKRYNALINSG